MLNIFAFYDSKVFSEITIRPEILSKVSMSNRGCVETAERREAVGGMNRNSAAAGRPLLPGGAGIRWCEPSGWAELAAAG